MNLVSCQVSVISALLSAQLCSTGDDEACNTPLCLHARSPSASAQSVYLTSSELPGCSFVISVEDTDDFSDVNISNCLETTKQECFVLQ